PPRLVGERARASLGRVVTGEQQQVLDDARRAAGFLGDDAEPLAYVRRRHLWIRQQEMRQAEDRREGIVDLVRHARRELADRRELLGVDQLGLGADALRVRELDLVALAQELGIEPRVVERDADLVRRRLEQG